MSEIAIQINGLGKMYRLHERPFYKFIEAFGLEKYLFWRKNIAQEFWSLRDLNLTIKKGERVGIIGRNGAGKSTLLKIISGNIASTEGSVRVNGTIQALLELGTGFHPEFTGRQNIRTSLSFHGLTGKQIKEKEEEIVDFAELDEFIDQPIKTYSAGMYARLAFSTATVVEPEILIIDEVLGAGDAYFTGKCVERMKRLTVESGATILFVSHDVSSIQRLCTKVIWINSGKIFFSGSPYDVVTEYLNHIRHETEIRLRAREMKLNKNNARTIVDTEDTYHKLLFRLYAKGSHPRREHSIYNIFISNEQENLGHIKPGEPMDNYSLNPQYIIDDPKTCDWTPPKNSKNKRFRCYANQGGKDFHAPFVFSIPKYFFKNLQSLSLEIEHSGTAGDEILVQIFDNSKYVTLGKLADKTSDKIFSSRFSIPLSQYFSTDLFLQKEERKKLKDTQDSKALKKEGSTKRKVCWITDVDFILKGNQSARVVPVGGWLKVDIYYEASESVMNPVFAITFDRIDGTQMIHQNTKLLGTEINELRGKGRASFIFDRLRLGVGEYMVTVAILKFLDLNNWHNTPPDYDRHYRKYGLSVYINELTGKNIGAVVQESTFTIEKDS